MVERGAKGLRADALGFASSLVIAVGSVAPAYTLAATLGFVVGTVGVQSPAVLWLAFLPMLGVASAYLFLNRADPDCGTTFVWVTRTMGPRPGWMVGWTVLVIEVIVLASLAYVAGLYGFRLLDADPGTAAITAAGLAWIVLMTAVATLDIQLSARAQALLLAASIAPLLLFAVVALVKVYAGDAPDTAVRPEPSWFSPLAVDSSASLISGAVLAVFAYYGWDAALRVNEETREARLIPGRSAIAAILALLGIYVLVATAVIAYAGPAAISGRDDVLSLLATQVLGDGPDKLVELAVLTSTVAVIQLVVLLAARTALSMASAGALPRAFGSIHPRYLTPHVASLTVGAAGAALFVVLAIASRSVLFDALAALGLLVALYYALSGFACCILYRHRLRDSLRTALLVGVAPLAGALALSYLFVRSLVDLGRPVNAPSQDSWLGVGPPLVIGLGGLLLGLIAMLARQRTSPEFFTRRPRIAPAPPLSPPRPES